MDGLKIVWFTITFVVLLPLIVISCFFAPRNSLMGLRCKWSEYNDITWKKSNRFCGLLLIVAEIVSAIFVIFLDLNLATTINVILTGIATIISIVYAKKIYDEEISKN